MNSGKKLKYSFLAIQLLICNLAFANTSFNEPINLGSLKDLHSLKGSGDNYYKFKLESNTPVSIFFNGLSAGYEIDLLDFNGTLLQKSSNNGSLWVNPSNPGITGGAIVLALNAANYIVHVVPIPITGNPIYKTPDNSYTLNLIPDNAPNMVIVAASDSEKVGSVNYTASGVNDEVIINKAIEEVGRKPKGGKILLRPGTYNISNNVLLTFDNITFMGTGWRTVLKLTNQVKLPHAGLLRSAFRESEKNKAITSFSNQHILHMSLDGNKAEHTDYSTAYGTYGTYTNCSFEDLRIHDFPHYGFDPHGNVHADPRVPTERLIIKESLSDHNDVDGMTTDATNHSTFMNNILDSNGRHGINVCTGSTNNTYLNNIITNNGATGIAIHPGGDLATVSDNNTVAGNFIQKNVDAGIYLFRTRNTRIINNMVIYTNNYGIHLNSSSENTVVGNTIHNNSNKDASLLVYMSDDGKVYSTYNKIINNVISSTLPEKNKLGIAESNALDDYNEASVNTLNGVSMRLRGPHSKIQSLRS